MSDQTNLPVDVSSARPTYNPQKKYGLGYRSPHFTEVVETRPKSVDWFEIISENYFPLGGKPRYFLSKLREHYPVACHGIGLSIASESDLNYRYLERLKSLIDFVDPMLVTDHLCWTGLERMNSYDLLPLPLTQSTLDHISRRVEKVQKFLGRQIGLENPSAYVAFADADFDEADFLMRLSERTGCGLLLDLNNIYVNHINLGLDTKAYIDTLKPESVLQFHMAGHSIGPGGIRIDTHDHPLYPEVLELYRIASAKFTKAPVLLEWDDKIPTLTELIAELDKVRENDRSQSVADIANAPVVDDVQDFVSQVFKGRMPIGQSAPTFADVTPELVASKGVKTDFVKDVDAESDQYQDRFLSLLQKSGGIAENDSELKLFSATTPKPREIGVQVYNQAYFLRIRDVLKEMFPALSYICGENPFSTIIRAYLIKCQPQTYLIDYAGDALPGFLQHSELLPSGLAEDSGVLSDIARFELRLNELFVSADANARAWPEMLSDFEPEEWEILRAFFIPAIAVEAYAYPVSEVVINAREQTPPTKPEQVSSYYLFYRPEHVVLWKSISEVEFAFANRLKSQPSFYLACGQAFAENAFGLDFETFAQQCVMFLVSCLQEGMIERIDLKGEVNVEVASAEDSPTAPLAEV